ncbi:MAG: sulfatase-like hydrolase/transferase, partial [Pirellulales bacterium]
SLYRSYWCGLHPLRPQGDWDDAPPLPARASDAGFHTVLITDEPRVADHQLAASFEQVVRVDAGQPDKPAIELEETALARLLAVAGQWFENSVRLTPDRPFLLWVHARGMDGPWDAPTRLRQAVADEDDPKPLPGIAVPRQLLDANADPDKRFLQLCAYAGQVTLLDQCLEAFLGQVFASPRADRTAVAFLGARGFPLGEHGRIGDIDETLHGESLHVPWLLRLPEPNTALVRSQGLVQPADLMPTLAQWLGVPCSDDGKDGTNLLSIASGSQADVQRALLAGTPQGERALRTTEWLLRKPTVGPMQLFAKPDDRWETNDVADRCEDVVEQLSLAMEQEERRLSSAW